MGSMWVNRSPNGEGEKSDEEEREGEGGKERRKRRRREERREIKGYHPCTLLKDF